MFELTLKQTHWLKFELTLKQTHNENGSVTRTKPQEIMVRSQPQRPTPLSDSPAAKNRFFNSMMLFFCIISRLKRLRRLSTLLSSSFLFLGGLFTKL